MIDYLVKVVLVQSLLFSLFMLIRNEGFFQLKRLYLLFTVVFSFLIPFAEHKLESTNENYFSVLLEPVNSTFNPIINTDPVTVNWLFFAELIILSGIIISVLFLVIKLSGLLYYIFSAKNKKTKDNAVIINHPSLRNNFSFFHWVFLKENQPDQEVIFLHESVHVRQFHSIDILIFEINKCIFWFNPLSYMMCNEAKLNHEFIADEQILKSCDVNLYKEMLLANAFQSDRISIGSTFSFSKLKNRFIMMNELKNKKFSWKILLALPLVAVVTLGFAFSKSNPNSNELTIKTTTILNAEKEPDVMPEFPGGMEAMAKFIGDNLKYPESAHKANISGKVVVEFVVSAEGKVMNGKVKKGFNSDCDAEALRVVNSMPNWKPGIKNNKKVDVEMILPIVFKL